MNTSHVSPIVCIIPAYNEERTIGEVVEGCLRYADYVLVVDDGSEDNTAVVAEKARAALIRHPFNLGVGAALLSGFLVGLTVNSKICVTLDGDGQHDPSDITRLVEPILRNEAEIVVGSRFVGGAGNMPLYKKWGNRILTKATSSASGLSLTDSQSGFRAYVRRAVEALIYDEPGYQYASESLILAARVGLRVIEVPIQARYIQGRARGTSISDGVRIFLHAMTARRRPN